MISINDKNFIFATFNDKVKLTPKMINNNILSNILKVLKIKNEGKCSKHGYIKSNSIEIVSKSFGKIEMQSLHGYVIYDVQFKACVCNPVIGNHIECVVKKINNFGILCTSQINENGSMVDVLDIIIPKHSYRIKSNVDFNDINVDINVIIEIVGKKYQLNKKTISVVGKIIAINTSNKFDNQIDIDVQDEQVYEDNDNNNEIDDSDVDYDLDDVNSNNNDDNEDTDDIEDTIDLNNDEVEEDNEIEDETGDNDDDDDDDDDDVDDNDDDNDDI